jgi:hypothetical protein
MRLEMRAACEKCDAAPGHGAEAFIRPNRGGGLLRRQRRAG